MKRTAPEKPKTDTLGPGTAGRTISGAAYRGHEVAAHEGLPMAEERGFPNRARDGKMAGENFSER